MTSETFAAAVTYETAAAAFNRFTNVFLARESLRKAQEELAYASSSISAGSPRAPQVRGEGHRRLRVGDRDHGLRGEQ